MKAPLQVLVIADSDEQTDALVHRLYGEDENVIRHRADSREALIAQLEVRPWDVVLSHQQSRRLKPAEALKILAELAPSIPFLCAGGASTGEITAVRKGLPACDEPEHRWLTQRLEQSEAMYRQLFDRVPIGIFRSTLDGKLIEVNRVVLERSGYDSLEALNRVGMHNLYVDYRDRERLVEMARTDSNVAIETRMRRANGETITIQLQARVIRNDQGVPLFLEGTLEDISERKRAEIALRESEIRYRTLVETISDWAWETDAKGNFSYSSPRVMDLLGYQPEEVLGKSPLKFMSPQEAERVAPIMNGMAMAAEPVVFEHMMLHRDGREIVLETQGMPYFDEEGRLAGHRGVDRDVTERRRADRDLRESQQMLQAVLDTIPVRVFWKDCDLVYLGCNKAFAQDANLSSPEEVVGLTDFDLLWKREESEFYREYDRRVMESDTPEFHIIEPQLRKDGSEAWVDTNKIPLHDADGNVVGVLGTYEDITELKRVEVELAKRNVELLRANEEAERLHRVKDEFIAMISHEFRSPLVTGKGYLEMLLSGRLGYLSDLAHEKMSVALRNLNRLSQLIDDIMSFHRMSHKEIRYQPHLGAVNLAAMFKECADEFLDRTGRSENQIQVDLVATDPVVLGDEEMIRRVISNLISNAEKHAGERANLTLRVVEVPEGKIRVSVSDDGSGMTPEQCQSAFEPFVTTGRFNNGMGLGLAIVRAILQAHGSEPFVQSEPGRGTAIWFDLPRAERGET
ncbi:MAG: PAS domain S-box protein [Bradymonadales bacterium]|nr:PAS domain S-box protein [Bradymonadales bacterium]